ncbi:hypothetical protein [Parvibium lacunae]|uniref:CdiI C-terminal domain-containing protein n=1 Tax=Parvibium lacunae TaxID=1888893 RepID=A0A368L3G9_9BURK|nr:hypothetical protein [Parvibium lacunae]RCS58075.1 hypothetical protein DU000_04340 [Parvibium lacunae]
MFDIACIERNSKIFCSTTLNDHTEITPLTLTFWNTDQYIAQWLDAINNLVSGTHMKVGLITDIQSPADSSGVVYWAVYRDNSVVYFQEHFCRKIDHSKIQSRGYLESLILPRKSNEEFSEDVSEWILDILDLKNWLHK